MRGMKLKTGCAYPWELVSGTSLVGVLPGESEEESASSSELAVMPWSSSAGKEKHFKQSAPSELHQRGSMLINKLGNPLDQPWGASDAVYSCWMLYFWWRLMNTHHAWNMLTVGRITYCDVCRWQCIKYFMKYSLTEGGKFSEYSE